ncbi:MAG: hypothetical protein HYR60_01110 [Acidobacteria bacterium]|nr:hypothetical protein [Acidobacteriota bacterium]
MKASPVMLCALLAGAAAGEEPLPGPYFRLMEAGAAQVQARFDAEPGADLEKLESRPGWRHFPYAILAPAVLYAQQHPQNRRYRDPRMLELAVRIGDLLAAEDERGRYEPRLDSDWDTYMWLEAWRLLQPELGEPRRQRWRRAIEKNIALLVPGAIERLDFPWYHSPFIGTSPNHYVQWCSVLHLGGLAFGKPEWVKLAAQVLRRFALVEQSPDGYWGEHNHSGPTTGYNHLTLTGVALYWEHSRDDAVLPALRRSTDFHKNYTFLDGAPVDVINDRNRHWGVSAWGQFAFSHFPDGRGYAAFLARFFRPEALTIDQLGRLSQDALYYHEGPVEPAPQEAPRYAHQMSVPAGIRKAGPWQVAFSGLMSTQAINSRFYLDRQGHLSVFHEKLGLIVTGANSKRQPELATFSEKLLGQVVHMPISTRLQMSEAQDRLSLAYNTFFSDLYVTAPSESELRFRFEVTGRGRPAEDPKLTLQLCLKAGEALETGSGKKTVLSAERVELGDLGGWIRHHGWTLQVDPAARLAWPVYPHNPYADGPETGLDHAVGALSVPLRLQGGRYIRPHEQEIRFVLSAP